MMLRHSIANETALGQLNLSESSRVDSNHSSRAGERVFLGNFKEGYKEGFPARKALQKLYVLYVSFM